MPIQRYSPSEARATTGAGAISSQARAQTWQTLSNTLDNWSNIFYQEGKAIRAQQGKEQALIDVEQDKFKPLGDFSIYDRAYRDAGHTAFSIHTQQDAKDYADFIEVEINNDNTITDKPKAFTDRYQKYSQTIIAEAPDEFTQALASQALNKYGVAKYNILQENHLKKVEQRNKEAYTSGLKLLEDEYINAYKRGDAENILQLSEQIGSLVNRGIMQEWTSDLDAGTIVTSLQKKAHSEKIIFEFDGSVKAYREYKKSDDKILNEDEKRAIEKKMVDTINEDVSIYDKEEKKKNDIITQTHTDTRKAFMAEWVYGTLTQTALDEAVAADEISQAAYDDLSKRVNNPGKAFDNMDELLTIKRNMLTVTDDEILNASLTHETKIRLLDERKNLVRSEGGAWASTVDGREAINRINRKFNIVEGSILNQFGTGALQEYDKVYRTFYDSVMALPIEQRELKALELSDAALSNYQTEKDTIREQRLEMSRKKEEEEKLKREEEEKNAPLNKFYNSMKSFAKDAFPEGVYDAY